MIFGKLHILHLLFYTLFLKTCRTATVLYLSVLVWWRNFGTCHFACSAAADSALEDILAERGERIVSVLSGKINASREALIAPCRVNKRVIMCVTQYSLTFLPPPQIFPRVLFASSLDEALSLLFTIITTTEEWTPSYYLLRASKKFQR